MSHMSDTQSPPLWRRRLALLKHPEMLKIVPIYCLGLIPLAVFLAWLGRLADHALGWPAFPPSPYNYICFGLGIGLGLIILISSYTCLIDVGDTAPASPSDQTRGLVKVGPYSWVRHPSIVGKLAGVMGLGCLMQSPFFMLIIIPLLLTYSLITNRIWQEIPLERRFGDEYLQYKKEVPMIVPKLSRIREFLFHGEKNAGR